LKTTIRGRRIHHKKSKIPDLIFPDEKTNGAKGTEEAKRDKVGQRATAEGKMSCILSIRFMPSEAGPQKESKWGVFIIR